MLQTVPWLFEHVSRVLRHGSKTLTKDQLNERATISDDLMDVVDSGLDILNRIITGDEMWCYLYDPQTKWQSSY